MNFKILSKTAIIGGLLLTFSQSAMSYKWLYDGSYRKKWSRQYFKLNANPAGFAGRYTKWRTSLTKAVRHFNRNPSRMYMASGLDNDSKVGRNGESEISWCSTTACTPATAYTYSKNGRITEADIIFYNRIPYKDIMEKRSYWGFGGKNRPFETTALHEIGHAVGMGHENRYYNIMGTDYQFIHVNGDRVGSYYGEDGSYGLRRQYGRKNRVDLSVVNYKYWKKSKAYSNHHHTKLYSNGSELSGRNTTSECPRKMCETTYNARAGQEVEFEVTAENLGSDKASSKISYYISTNNAIASTDTLLATDNISLEMKRPETIKKKLTLPENLTAGKYWLGAVIDPDGTLKEAREDNNATYTAIQIGNEPLPLNGGERMVMKELEGTVNNYTIEVSEAHSKMANAKLTVILAGSNGDADLSVSYSSDNTRESFRCSSNQYGSAENCIVDVTNHPGIYYIDISGYTGFENVALTANITGTNLKTVSSGDRVKISGTEDSVKHFKINIPEDSEGKQVFVKLVQGSGDADLFISKDYLPYRDAADC